MGSANVAEVAVAGTSVMVNATAGAPFVGTVATFTDPAGAEPNSFDPTPGIGNHYTASINWGDATPVSTGTITFSSGVFTVSSNHIFAATTTYTITTTINHESMLTTVLSPAKVVNLGTFEQGQQTKPTNWWAGSLGQELVGKFGLTGANQTLGQWLATYFPKLYGGASGAPNLSASTNAQVYAYFLNLWNTRTSPRSDAEVMATAFAEYATTLFFGGTVAQSYGFVVNAFGLGAYSVNIGYNGAAFGVPNGTVLNVYQILLAANNSASGGKVWPTNLTVRNMGLAVFALINGDLF